MNYYNNTFFRYWLPLVAYCLLIFVQPWLPLPISGVMHLDKFIHFAVYAVLGILLFRAIMSVTRGSKLIVAVIITMILSALVGVGDEFHQVFVPSRAIDREDFLYDMLGASAGVVFCTIIYGLRRRSGVSLPDTERD